MEWFNENYEKLKTEFADKWVAVNGHKVLEVKDDLHELMAVVKAKYKNSECLLIERIARQAVAMYY